MSPTEPKLGFPDRQLKRAENQVDRIKLINEDFKLSGILCRLGINKKTLFIRYQDLDGNRKTISPPGCDLSPPGILAAQNMATIISQALRLRNYSQEWLDLEIFHKTEKAKAIVLTIGVVQSELTDKWLKYRSGDTESTDRQKLHTLTNYVRALKRLAKLADLTDKHPFDRTTIKLMMDIYPEGSDKRFRAKETLSIICTIFGISYSFKGIGKRPKAKERKLPTDSKIIEKYHSMNCIKYTSAASAKYYRWVFGILATYGLRPQEIAAIDKSKSFNPDLDNWLFLDGSLCDGIKTGDRAVPPLLSNWVELFDLKSYPDSPYSTKGDPQRRACMIADYFRAHDLGIRPYDLRHAYAIRGDKLGKPLVAMARAMGHDVSTHVKIYQKWISIKDQIESFNRTN
jgi:integrase